jgi:hypothetical protein
MHDDELKYVAELDQSVAQGSLFNLIAAARGEYSERRALRLVKLIPGVKYARRASQYEDLYQATDIVVNLSSGARVPLQVKAAATSKGSESKKTASRHCVTIVRIPITMSDADALQRIKTKLGLQGIRG